MNSSQDEEEDEDDVPETDEKSNESLSLSDNEESDVVTGELSPDAVSLEAPDPESPGATSGPAEEQEVGGLGSGPRQVESPPAWIPDSMAPLCMGCAATTAAPVAACSALSAPPTRFLCQDTASRRLSE